MRIILSFVIALLLYSCSSKHAQTEALINALKPNDTKLEAPQPGDWLYTHKETGQTFLDYVNSRPVAPTDSQNVIYLQPIGDFDSLQFKMISLTSGYLKSFFGLKTVILKTIPNTAIPDSARRIGASENEQFLATYIIYELLKKNLPKDAIGLMAVTEKDLYPKPSWNYVFGLSSIRDKVGVTSLYRFSDGGLKNEDYRQCLNRMVKVSSHEIGHMFSVKHCINAVCLMNGSNSLYEADGRPNRLCSECAGKLSWNLKFNELQRMNELAAFFKKHGLDADYEKIIADIKQFQKKNSPFQKANSEA